MQYRFVAGIPRQHPPPTHAPSRAAHRPPPTYHPPSTTLHHPPSTTLGPVTPPPTNPACVLPTQGGTGSAIHVSCSPPSVWLLPRYYLICCCGRSTIVDSIRWVPPQWVEQGRAAGVELWVDVRPGRGEPQRRAAESAAPPPSITLPHHQDVVCGSDLHMRSFCSHSAMSMSMRVGHHMLVWAPFRGVLPQQSGGGRCIPPR